MKLSFGLVVVFTIIPAAEDLRLEIRLAVTPSLLLSAGTEEWNETLEVLCLVKYSPLPAAEEPVCVFVTELLLDPGHVDDDRVLMGITPVAPRGAPAATLRSLPTSTLFLEPVEVDRRLSHESWKPIPLLEDATATSVWNFGS